jgi:glycosyltransferase 2 family protein
MQIGIGLADLGCSALAMYSVIPTGFGGEFPTIAIAFVSATVLGFASHAPGSLGVFDAAMLIALPEVPKEELIAGLLVFRILYFLVPFCLALLTTACWESALLLCGGGWAPRTGTTAISKEQPAAAAQESKSSPGSSV